MLNTITNTAKTSMERTLEVLRKHLMTIRTGRASVSILDGIKVDYYGTPTPISQVANLQVLDSRTLSIKAWEKPMLKLIEKAILEANLGLSPVSDSDMLRIPVPQLTEERRKEFVRQAKQKGEEAKLAVRNARRDANEELKKAVKESKIAEDEEKRGLKTVQEMTDKFVAEIDKALETKEAEIMTV